MVDTILHRIMIKRYSIKLNKLLLIELTLRVRLFCATNKQYSNPLKISKHSIYFLDSIRFFQLFPWKYIVL